MLLGSGLKNSKHRQLIGLARTGAFRRVYGIDSSISAVRAMSRYAKALDHGGRGWDIVRYVRADLTQPGQFRRDASLVLDEGVLDVLQAGPGIDARQVMNAYVERAAGLVRQGGALIVVGYAGNPAVVNQTTLELSCWTRGGGFLGLDALGADPRRACSPWGPGAHVLTRRRAARPFSRPVHKARNNSITRPPVQRQPRLQEPVPAQRAHRFKREVLVRRVVVEVVEVEEAPVHADEDDVVPRRVVAQISDESA